MQGINFKYAFIGAILGVVCLFLLVACEPKKEEGSPVAQTKEEQSHSAPAVVPSAPQATEKKHEDELTPQQKEELEINEDDVMTPLPG